MISLSQEMCNRTNFLAQIIRISHIIANEIAVEMAAPCNPQTGIKIKFNTRFTTAETTVEIAKTLLFLAAEKKLPTKLPMPLNMPASKSTEAYFHPSKKSFANIILEIGMLIRINAEAHITKNPEMVS